MQTVARPGAAPRKFGEKVRVELGTRGWGLRKLARKMNPANPEQARRGLNRWVNEGMTPNQANRARVAAALGVAPESLEDDEDDEEDAMALELLTAVRKVIRAEKETAA